MLIKRQRIWQWHNFFLKKCHIIMLKIGWAKMSLTKKIQEVHNKDKK
jgi:hypothetical protein